MKKHNNRVSAITMMEKHSIMSRAVDAVSHSGGYHSARGDRGRFSRLISCLNPVAIIEAIESRVMLSGTLPMSTPMFVAYSTNPDQSVASLTDRLAAGSGSPGGLTPAEIRGAYGLGPYGSSNVTFNGVQGDGSGETIALIDALNAPTIVSDLTAFDAHFGLPNPPSFQVLNENGGAIANQTATSGTTPAPSGSSGDSIESSLDVEWAHVMAPQANIILYEANSLSDADLFTAATTAAKTAGVSVVSMSFGGGEPGGTTQTNYDKDFLTPSGHSGVTFFASTGDSGAAVEYPAESPNVVAVGGTTLTIGGVGSGNYSWLSESAWSSGGGGTSAYESQPSYQAGTITATKREAPDVSADANPSSGVPIYDAYDEGAGTPWATYGGTSLSSPLWAGMVAVADQGRALEGDTGTAASLTSNQTLTRLYQLSKANFHDITTGSNGHQAVAGYDEATGIGTPIANVLLPDLAGAATITGQVFIDNTGNGIFGGTDTPVAGATVYLDLNNDGVLDNSEPSTTTNAQGFYTFTDEPAGGVIRLTSAAPAGYTLSSPSSANIVYGATDTVNFTYTGPSQVVLTSQPSNTTYGSPLNTITAAVENPSGATMNVSSSVTLTLSSGTFTTGLNTATVAAVDGVATFTGLTVAHAGTYTLTASDGTLTTATSNSFQITQVTATVTWTPTSPITYGTPLGSAQLDATASVPGTFIYSPAAGTVLGAGSNQTLQVTFTPTDSVDYASANASTSITVSQATPTLSWSSPSPITYGIALGIAQLDATANVAGTFLYTPAAGTVLGAGAGQTLRVVFTPTDSTDYTTANASTGITVLQATPVVSWLQPSSILYGTPLSSTQLDATANVAGTFLYTPGTDTVLGAGAGQTLSVIFTPTDSTDYTTANGSTGITVLQATPTVSWLSPLPIVYGTPLSSTQLDATADVPGTFVYNPAAGAVLSPGANQSLGVVFTPTDSTDYTTASASALITVTGVISQPINLTGSDFYLKLDNATPQNLDIWTNATGTGTPADVQEFDTVSSITLSANGAGDSFTADFSNGSVVPAGGLTVNGFGSASSNSLTVVGTGGSDTVTVPGDGNFNINSQTIAYTNISAGTVYFAPGGSGEALTIPSTSVTLAPGTSSGITTDAFSSISIAGSAELLAPPAATHAQRLLIQTAALSLGGSTGNWTGTLDLSNNDLDIASGSLATTTSQVAQGYSTGTGGIISSAAQTDTTQLTALGVIQNSVDGTPTGASLYGSSSALGTFDGTSPASTDVLVKYTYYGDANLSGSVDGSDYARIDSAVLTGATGWYNGDFNYDGVINGSDYTLIDNADNTQGASLAAQVSSQATTAATHKTSVFSQSPISDPSANSISSWATQPANVAAQIFSSTGDDSLLKLRVKKWFA